MIQKSGVSLMVEEEGEVEGMERSRKGECWRMLRRDDDEEYISERLCHI